MSPSSESPSPKWSNRPEWLSRVLWICLFSAIVAGAVGYWVFALIAYEVATEGEDVIRVAL